MLIIDLITNRVFNSRTYILAEEDTEKVRLVDGGDTNRVLEMIRAMGVEGGDCSLTFTPTTSTAWRHR